MAKSVLTLIAAPGAAAAVAAAAAEAAAALARLGAEVLPPDWLAPGIACDIFFDELDTDQADAAARAALAAAFGPLPLDLVAQPAADRRKRLLVADMESTIIANEMLDELADFLGIRERIAEITRRAMNDEIDFAGALRERVGLLRGLAEATLAEAGARIRITPGAAALVATMRAHGAYTVLVSGGFSVYTSRIAAELGFDLHVANELVVAEGRLAGAVREPVLTRDDKLATLKRLAAERDLPLAATLAVGDGANDLGMLQLAGSGVALHAKPAVAAAAAMRVDHGDLTALLYIQGYRRSEFAG